MSDDGSKPTHEAGTTPPAAEEFARPSGWTESFGAHDGLDQTSFAAPPVSGMEAAAFGRPNGGSGEEEAGFAPPPGARLAPSQQPRQRPVHPAFASAFGRPATADANGFDAPAGTRLEPGTAGRNLQVGPPRPAGSWWDNDSEAWLGRGAVFRTGQPEQLHPSEDTETTAGAEPLIEESEVTRDVPADGEEAASQLGLREYLTLAIIVILAASLGGVVGYFLAERSISQVHDRNVKFAKTGTPANRPAGSVADIAQRVLPAVVSIDIRTANVAGTGSGVIIDKGGYILTNNHVVSAAAKSGTITVTYNNNSTEKATIVGRDPQTDLAVLKVRNSKITVAALGDSAKLAVGDPVVAIGSPLGLTATVTTGIVSALGRPVHLSGSESDTDAVIAAVQTDAAINPGNSGGALVDASGAVIGINSAIASLGTQAGAGGNIGLGFAIPINFAQSIAQQLIATGKATHPDIGIAARAVTDGTRDGAYVVQVEPGGPAEKAGIQNGDVITAVDGGAVLSSDFLAVMIENHKPGDVVTLHLFRQVSDNQSKELDIKVTLGSS